MSLTQGQKAPETYEQGIDAALRVIALRLHYWRTRRIKASFPPGMIESELQSVETRIRALRNRSPA